MSPKNLTAQVETFHGKRYRVNISAGSPKGKETVELQKKRPNSLQNGPFSLDMQYLLPRLSGFPPWQDSRFPVEEP